jgi:hypothetical protein
MNLPDGDAYATTANKHVPASTSDARRLLGSGRERRGTRLGVGAGTEDCDIRSLLVPDNASGRAIRMRDRSERRRVDRCSCAGKATERAGAAVLTMIAGLIAGLASGGSAVVADFSRGQRVGCRNRRRPARTDWCKNLHHQGDHHDRKKSLYAPPHPWKHSVRCRYLIISMKVSRDQANHRSGYNAGNSPIFFDRGSGNIRVVEGFCPLIGILASLRRTDRCK